MVIHILLGHYLIPAGFKSVAMVAKTFMQNVWLSYETGICSLSLDAGWLVNAPSNRAWQKWYYATSIASSEKCPAAFYPVFRNTHSRGSLLPLQSLIILNPPYWWGHVFPQVRASILPARRVCHLGYTISLNLQRNATQPCHHLLIKCFIRLTSCRFCSQHLSLSVLTNSPAF